MVIDRAVSMKFSYGILLHRSSLLLLDKVHATLLFFIWYLRRLRSGCTLSIFEQSLGFYHFWCTFCIPRGSHCAAVTSGVRSACCRIGARIDSCRFPRRKKPSSTERINLVLQCRSLVHKRPPPSPSVSSNDCHTVLGDSLSSRNAPSLCLILIWTECSSLCSTVLAPGMSWKFKEWLGVCYRDLHLLILFVSDVSNHVEQSNYVMVRHYRIPSTVWFQHRLQI